MKTNIFLQARMGSTRLPGKVLMKIEGKSIIEILVERLRRVPNIDRIVLVTSTEPANEALVEEAKRLAIDYFQGNEENLLDRLYQASLVFSSEAIVRVTGDCPLIDPALIVQARDILEKEGYDMVSNVRVRSYPDGMDVEVFKQRALKEAWEALVKDNPESLGTFMSPTKYIHHQERFREFDMVWEPNQSQLRVTLDYPEDLEVIRLIYLSLSANKAPFDLKNILDFLQTHPEVALKNKAYACFDYGHMPSG